MTTLPIGRGGEDALAVAVAAAREAGRIALGHRRRAVAVSHRGRANVTTDADLAAEAAILSRVRAAFPEHDILAEESGASGSAGRLCWIIDPIDGTFNYALGIPLFSVSIALLVDGRPIVGVIFDPAHDELFAAVAGGGATLNGESIGNLSGRSFREAVVGYDLGYHDERARRAIEIEQRLWGQVQLFRCLGSAALGLAYTAAGRFDLYFHHFLAPWDFAAGWLLIEEAGGSVFEAGGTPLSLTSRSIPRGESWAHCGVSRGDGEAGPPSRLKGALVRRDRDCQRLRSLGPAGKNRANERLCAEGVDECPPVVGDLVVGCAEGRREQKDVVEQLEPAGCLATRLVGRATDSDRCGELVADRVERAVDVTRLQLLAGGEGLGLEAGGAPDGIEIVILEVAGD
ncbi:MAG: hypothetical protein KatS3mg060_2643 [Dehalococcoidia bacterium]|nr:MAG: hypothetical protein KatS3mg060_2643 [Dehalococcoidia bacterium]